MDRPDSGGGKPVFRTVAAKSSLLQPKESIGGTHPKPVPIHRKAADIIAREGRFGSVIEHPESNAIEAHQSALSCHPQITIGCLHDAVHAALREPLFRGPDLLAKIAKILCPALARP
jgi:hypothetical protein